MKTEDLLESLSIETGVVCPSDINASKIADFIRAHAFFNHPKYLVRIIAINLALLLKIENLEPEIRVLLKDPDPWVRSASTRYYEIFSSLSDEMVKAIFNDKDGSVRQSSFYVLISRVTPQQVRSLNLDWHTPPISPWSSEAYLLSPDKTMTACFSGGEIAMSSPTVGSIQIGSMTISHVNASMVWSDDSKLLAYPVWNDDRSQSLSAIELKTGRKGRWPIKDYVFELQLFDKGVLTAKVNPLTENRTLTYKTSDIEWI
jgi:hypothetical protein